jgi:hydroxyethylthiazole kinase-like uncharacterized protein yjeF
MASLPDGALMQRAAGALASECLTMLGGAYGRRVLLLVGAGNNGGDALYAGAVMARRGARVQALLIDPDRVHQAAVTAFRAAGGRLTDSIGAPELVVDGILGIGGRGGLRDRAAELLPHLTGLRVVAVDVPSGVDADTGIVDGVAINADVTVTFGELKPGLLVGAGREHVGELRLVDIGLTLPPPALQVLEALDVAAMLPTPGDQDDKYTRGVVGVVAGSPAYGGAAVLCVGAALHGGAGMVRYAGTAPDAVRARWPEVVVHDGVEAAGQVQAWVIGPGLGTDDGAVDELERVLAGDVPVLIDADAITLLASRRHWLDLRKAPTVLTPHDREFERVFGPVGSDRVGAARRAAEESGATVLLKGNATVIAKSNGHAYVNRTGTPWLGTAGSGDVLSGLIGSILAGAVEPTLAAACGAHVHGLAGQLAAIDGPPSAGDVLGALRAARRTLAG